MNGFLAALFWTSTIVSPNASIIDGLLKKPAQPFRNYSYSVLEYNKELVGSEIQISQSRPFTNGPLQGVVSLSMTDQRGFWAGYGFYNDFDLTQDFDIGFSFIPGVYSRGDEVNLGGWLMFRSGLHLNYSLTENTSISLSYDHRSSGDLWKFNPGLETWQMTFRNYI